MIHRYRALIITFAVYAVVNGLDILSSLLNDWYTPGIQEMNRFARTATGLFDLSKGVEVKLIYAAVYVSLSLVIVWGLNKGGLGARLASMVASVPMWFSIYPVMDAVIGNTLFLFRFDK